jgi:Cd2+/Zn2+-exporting ATPase
MNKYKIKNIDCASCATKIENGLSKMEEVKSCSVNFATSTLHIDTDNFEKVKAKVKEIEPEVEIEEIEVKKNIVSKSEILENKLQLLRIFLTVIFLAIGLIYENQLHQTPYHFGEYLIYGIAYLLSGYKVILGALRNIIKGKIFDEHFLMTIATLGAMGIDAMSEAVAVMLFYVVGELFQDIAVNRSRRSIKSLLEIKPDYANIKSDGEIKQVPPDSVKIGDIIIVKAGEKIPLDGEIIEGNSFVDTSALTGESVPRKVKEKETVLAGMINQSGLLTIRVTKLFSESSISIILELVENAVSKKAETEKFITTFARYYTPVVVFGALLIAIVPPLIITGQTFSDWIYRALIVLVISCPCALVISIPLGYFGGIGGASKKGILIKGSNFLDALTNVKTVFFDKTGTLTKGEFRVTQIYPSNGFTKDQILEAAAYAELNSNHPIAKSIIEAYDKNIELARIGEVKEIPGLGVKALINGNEILAGNDKFLHKENIEHAVCDAEGTVVHIVMNKIYSGHIIISDTLKDDSIETIIGLKNKGINSILLTGDSKASASIFAEQLGIKEYYYELYPQDKVEHIEELISKKDSKDKIVFVGDGINDAPVLARSDVGIAMGALGSDAAIETADIVLMNDSPSSILTAVNIAKKTRKIVLQNIILAIGIKMFFIILGVFGVATMWEAVFGDMGVALIAVFNAIRVYK